MAGNAQATIVGGSFQEATGTTPVNWYFENPDLSAIRMELTRIEVEATAPSRIQFLSNLTSYTGGSALTPSNPTVALNGYVPVVVQKAGGTIDGGTPEDFEGYVDRGMPYHENGLSILPQDNHFVVLVTPRVSSESYHTDVCLRAYWKELPA